MILSKYWHGFISDVWRFAFLQNKFQGSWSSLQLMKAA